MPSHYFGNTPSSGYIQGLRLNYVCIGGGIRQNGRFTQDAASNQMKSIYARVAIDLQQATADHIQRKIIRQSVSSGKLVRATLNVRNRNVTNSSMQVGVKSWLDPATRNGSTGRGGYHDLIETGSAGTNYKGPMVDSHDGYPLYGSWVPNGGKQDPYRRYYRRTTYQQLKVSSPAARRKIYERTAAKGKTPFVPVRKRDIQPLRSYEHAWRQVGPIPRIKREIREVLRNLGYPVSSSGPIPKGIPQLPGS